MQRRGIAIEVNGCVLEPTGVDSEGSDSLDSRKGRDSEIETSVGAAVLKMQEEVANRFHGFNGVGSPSTVTSDVEAEAQRSDEGFLSRELILNSQAIISNRTVSQRKMEMEDNSEPLTVCPQMPGEPDRWWQIPDFIYEVLPLPKNFNLQLEVSSVFEF